MTEGHHGDARGIELLLQAVQELSMARDLDKVMTIVRRTARELTGADGATFVLRDSECCYYADEDAIAPLWKGKRFPLQTCISGWAMLHREPVVIEDIYSDPRIPIDVYRPTFVKSLVMVPIRHVQPVGAIGNYWANRNRPSDANVRLLQALADSTSIAMENIDLLESLESRVAERTAQLEDANRQLEVANRELEAFSYTVSHDLRAPLRSIAATSQIMLEDHGNVLGPGCAQLEKICSSVEQMRQLIDDLLRLARMASAELTRAPFDLAVHAREIVKELCSGPPERRVDVVIPERLPAHGDARLVRVVLENLLSNAWKFSAQRPITRIEVGTADGAFFVRDNGVGFKAAEAEKLFAPFQRLHDASVFEGHGIGLSTARRIVLRHNGRIWAQALPGGGATFWFTLG
jgi:signal transduction histidine kinase